ncbi:mechanosensitive ion channel family protein [Haliangium sp.]|uniref:mechanosensitive ion channel family protein n=1 Tax=Haliangium sp. TaxID=2663208 RepID=UPI003D14433B
MWTEIVSRAQAVWAYPPARAGTIVVGAIVAAYLVERVVCRGLAALTRRTKTDIDDKIIEILRRPIFLSMILAGLAWALAVVVEPGTPRFIAYALLRTLAVMIWTAAAFQIGTAVLEALSSHGRAGSLVQPRTLPLFDIIVKVLIIGGAVYFTFLAWSIDVTAWLASAGIVGIAVGFAAKDSLANLITGIFILADSPYKVGDWIVLDGNLRGEVRRIGVRSTRVLTRDDVEITVPNSVMGNAMIVNEAGGPYIKQRIAATVSVAYTSDVDHVAEVIVTCAEGVAGVAEFPRPTYRFRSFGASGLDFDLLVWTEKAAQRGQIISDLNMRIFKRFAEEGIEIPYSKHDVYIKQMPGAEADAHAPHDPAEAREAG